METVLLSPETPDSPVVPYLDLRTLAVLALAVRLLHLAFVLPTPMASYHRFFTESDMYMFDQWAQKIRAGDVLGHERNHYLYRWQLSAAPVESWTRWYGDRPTFYKAPFYPYLIALLYRLFGDALVPLVVLQVLASTAAVVLLFEVTRRLLGTAAAAFAGLLLALYAPDVHYDAVMLRGPWIVFFSLLATWRLILVRDRPGFRSALLAGLAVSATLLVNEGFAPAIAFAGLFVLVWSRRSGTLVRALFGFALGVVLPLLPVLVRNALVGAPLFKLAVTGSTVYAVFNSAAASPFFFTTRPSIYLPIIERSGGGLLATALECLRSFGHPWPAVLFYLGKVLGLLVPYENPDNVNFYYAALKSPLLRWLPHYGLLLPLAALGLVLAPRRRAFLPLLPAAAPILMSILLTLALSRYRATLAVYLMPAAGLALARLVEWARQGRLRPLLAAGGGMLLGFLALSALQSRVVFAGLPEGVYLYRPVEFQLSSDFYARQGRLDAAAREMLDLARVHPDPDMKGQALAALAELKGRQGDLLAAREALAGARLFAPSNPALLLSVGDLYADLLHDRAEAAATYQKARALPGPDSLHGALDDRLKRLAPARELK